MRYAPRDHQKTAQSFLAKRTRAALFLDMGLGKTAVLLKHISRLVLQTKKSKGVLVIAPLRVCRLVWENESNKWDEFNSIEFSKVLGSDVNRFHALLPGADVYLINFENVSWLCDWLKQETGKKDACIPFDTLVIDESSRMKSPKAKRFKNLKKVLHIFKRRYLMTGTPSPQGYQDLWAQICLLDDGQALGVSYSQFIADHFDYDPYSYSCKLKDGAGERINAKLKPFCLSMKSEDHLKLPELIANKVQVEIPKKALELYRIFERDLFAFLKSGHTLEAPNGAALSMRCRQITSGAVYREDGTYEVVHTAKMDAVEEIVENLNGSPVLLVYEFRHELDRLRKLFPEAPVIGGGVKCNEERVNRDWNAGRLPVLIIHPASAGHGLNLQDGGHTMVWTSGTWSLEAFQQTIKRLHRSGQRNSVIVHTITADKTIDGRVADALVGKGMVQSGLMEALKSQPHGLCKVGSLALQSSKLLL